MASKAKRERLRSHRLYRKDRRRAIGVSGVDLAMNRTITGPIRTLARAWANVIGSLVGLYDNAPDDRTHGVVLVGIRGGKLKLRMYREVWASIEAQQRREKRHNTKLLGFWKSANDTIEPVYDADGNLHPMCIEVEIDTRAIEYQVQEAILYAKQVGAMQIDAS